METRILYMPERYLAVEDIPGLPMVARDMPRQASGQYCTTRVRCQGRGIASVVVVNRGGWGERRRFTLAHELGHMTLDPATRVNVEKAAHRFASAFLMPAETVRAEIGRHRKSIGWGQFLDLKRIFGVSVQALAYRCKDPGIFGAPLFRQLFREFARGGWRSPPYQEPEVMPGKRPTRFESLCFRALSKGAISEARARGTSRPVSS